MLPAGRRRDSQGRTYSPTIFRSLPVLVLLALLPLGMVGVLITGSVQGQRSQTITMGDIFFDTGSFSVEPGENLTLRLINAGLLVHTFTLFAQVNARVPVEDNAALQAYNDTNAKVVDVTLDGGQEREVRFVAPATNGTYTYVCMVPNHSVAGMFGVLNVGPSGGTFGIGIVQGIFLITLAGVLVFAVVYHVRSTRS